MPGVSARRSRREFLKFNSSLVVLSAFVVTAGSRRAFADPIPVGGDVGQHDWRFCNKCNGLFYNGYADKGVCPGGGSHVAQGFSFVLPFNTAPKADTQKDWRFCGKCKVMFFDGYPTKGRCPAGGGHSAMGDNFVLHHDTPTNLGSQNNWRFCNKCNGMFYDGYPAKGHCPAGGGHVAQGFNFVLSHPSELPSAAGGGGVPTAQFQYCAASCDVCRTNGFSCSPASIYCPNTVNAPAACFK